MSKLQTCVGVEKVDPPDRLLEVIPGDFQAGLPRVGLLDGGIQSVEARTDQVFATCDVGSRFWI
jgi:hypothetical protein